MSAYLGRFRRTARSGLELLRQPGQLMTIGLLLLHHKDPGQNRALTSGEQLPAQGLLRQRRQQRRWHPCHHHLCGISGHGSLDVLRIRLARRRLLASAGPWRAPD